MLPPFATLEQTIADNPRAERSTAVCVLTSALTSKLKSWKEFITLSCTDDQPFCSVLVSCLYHGLILSISLSIPVMLAGLWARTNQIRLRSVRREFS